MENHELWIIDQGTVLHELGHMLGLICEHQNLASGGFHWDKEEGIKSLYLCVHISQVMIQEALQYTTSLIAKCHQTKIYKIQLATQLIMYVCIVKHNNNNVNNFNNTLHT